MFTLDRETAIIVALVACVAASYYIYTDLRKSKEDITKITKFLDSVTSELPSDMYMQGAPPQAVTNIQPEPVVNEVQTTSISDKFIPVQKSP
jgi:hypothetical protein